MIKFYLALVCVVSTLFAQVQPRPARVEGVALPNVRGNLAGFQPILPVWPNLSVVEANPPDGIIVAASLTVVDGKPMNIQLLEGIRPFTKPVLDALQQWRFEMPVDGTSPVIFDVTYRSRGGRIVPDVEVHLSPVDQEPPLELVYKPAAPYPPGAMSAGIEGIVEFRVTVSRDGTVGKSEIIRGPESLRQSAFETARLFRFKPDATLPRQGNVSIEFKLP